ESSQPLYVWYYPFLWKNRDEIGVPEWPIRVIAIMPDAEHQAFRKDRMPGFAAQQDQLRAPRTVLMDQRSKPLYDAIRRWRDGGPSPIGIEREVGGKSVTVVGLFQLGTDFSTDGNLIMNARNLADFLPDRDPLESVHLGLVKLSHGADPNAVQQALRAVLPPDVRVLTPEQLAAEEEGFWTQSTPVGFIFLMGLLVGFVVG